MGTGARSLRESPYSSSSSAPTRRGRCTSRTGGTRPTATRWPVSSRPRAGRCRREYYFNDGGNQIRALRRVRRRPVRRRYYGEEWPVSDPESLYKGELHGGDRAGSGERARREPAEGWIRGTRPLPEISAFADRLVHGGHQKTLARVGGPVRQVLQREEPLRLRRRATRCRGAREARDTSTRARARCGSRLREFGDDKDRVLVKSDGTYTYVAPDIAYHRDKWERGFRTAVNVLGADHAGYGPRIRAGLVALGLPREFLDVELVRLVKLVREGEQVKFSKRAGNVVDPGRASRRGRGGRGALLLRALLAQDRDELRPRPRHPPVRREPRLLRAVRPRPHREHLRAGRDRPRRGRGDPEPATWRRRSGCSSWSCWTSRAWSENAAARREVHPLPTYLETLATRFHQFYTVHRVLVDEEDSARAGSRCAPRPRRARAGLDFSG